MDARIRVALSPYMTQLVQGVAKLMNRSPTDTLELLLFRIETAGRHGKLEDLGLGLEWMEIAAVLNVNGHGAANKDPVAMDGAGDGINFNVELLEKSTRSRTGFAGVYPTGSSFRALVPDPKTNGTRYLQSRGTSVQAAIDRYQWFAKHGLPYGNIGLFVEWQRKSFPNKSILEHLIEARNWVNAGLKHEFTAAEVEAAISAYRAANDIPDERNEEDLPLAKAEPATTALPVCGVCNEQIAAHEKFAFYGAGNDVAHVATCLDLSGKPFPPDVIRAVKASKPA